MAEPNTTVPAVEEKGPITDSLLSKMNEYWMAANYLSAAQLYLLDNPLLKKPLTRDMIKHKIVGHWGTVPGQNFVFVHCNRVIKRYDLDMILLSGPGHGGNFFIANSASASRAGCLRIVRRRRRAPLTRVGSLVIRWLTALAPFLIIRI